MNVGFTNYLLPEPELLTPTEPHDANHEQLLRDDASKIVEILTAFELYGHVVHIAPGPVFTVFEFKADPGTTASRISKRAEDLSLALYGRAVRVTSSAGKSHLAIEVLNERPEVVGLRDLVESSRFHESASLLTVALGRTTDGFVYLSDLAALPHLLVAGSTGSGKSSCLHSIILSILYKARPDEVKFILIDPRRVELGVYSDIPHLATPIITAFDRAAISLQWAVTEADRRYKDLAAYGVPSIDHFNREVRRRNSLDQFDEQGERHRLLPYLVIVIDEIGELLGRISGVSETLSNLAGAGRAVGIHLVVSTGRPSAEVITPEIKANFPARIAFSTVSRLDSRTILDAHGAEELRGNGDALFLPPKMKDLVRIQAAYTDFGDIKRVIEFVKTQGQPEYRTFDEDDDLPGRRDPLFPDALRCVLQAKRASTALLQRHLKIGYGRAAAILDAMVREGYVGDMDGPTRARPILAKAYEDVVNIDNLDNASVPNPRSNSPSPIVEGDFVKASEGSNSAKPVSVIFLVVTIILLVVSCGSCSEHSSLYKQRISGIGYVTEDQMSRLAVTGVLTLIGAAVTAFLSLMFYIASEVDITNLPPGGLPNNTKGRRGRAPNLFGRRRKSSIIKGIKRDIRKFGD